MLLITAFPCQGYIHSKTLSLKRDKIIEIIVRVQTIQIPRIKLKELIRSSSLSGRRLSSVEKEKIQWVC